MTDAERREAAWWSDEEREKYEGAWTGDAYRTPSLGLQLWQGKPGWFPPPDQMKHSLDIGCGRGLVLDAWLRQGIDAKGVDIAENALDPQLRDRLRNRVTITPVWEMSLGHRFDFGLCCDVAEHLPPDLVTESLDRIVEHCERTLFKIACFPNVLGRPDLHLTVETPDWWLRRLQAHGDVTTVHLADDPESVEYPYLVAMLRRRQKE